jgi:hypothetical protein
MRKMLRIIRTSVGVIGLGVLVSLLANTAGAYSVGAINGGDENHEDITEAGINFAPNGINAFAMQDIIDGNVNADTKLIRHKFDPVMHLNSASTANGQFNRSDALMDSYLSRAAAYARDNPRFLKPRYEGADGIVEALNRRLRRVDSFVHDNCKFSPTKTAKCLKYSEAIIDLRRSITAARALEAVDAQQLVLASVLDPHTTAGEAFKQIDDDIEVLSTRVRVINANDSGGHRTALENLRLEVRGYLGRQYLGHAFHSLQDFYAHSNVTELLYDNPGPDCQPVSSARQTACDRTPIAGRSAMRRDVVSGDNQKVAKFLRVIHKDPSIRNTNMRLALDEDDFARLQTGYVEISAAGVAEGLAGWEFHQAMCPAGHAQAEGLTYCHWASGNTPGLNKDADDGHTPNHAKSRALAEIATAIAWEKFLLRAGLVTDLPEIGISDTRLAEGDEGENVHSVSVSLSAAAKLPVSFQYDVTKLSQTDAPKARVSACKVSGDVVRRRGFALIETGERSVTIDVKTCGDRDVEPTEVFAIYLRDIVGSAPDNGTGLFTMSVLNDDIIPQIGGGVAPVNPCQKRGVDCNALNSVDKAKTLKAPRLKTIPKKN